jgi:hypothetical protein
MDAIKKITGVNNVILFGMAVLYLIFVPSLNKSFDGALLVVEAIFLTLFFTQIYLLWRWYQIARPVGYNLKHEFVLINKRQLTTGFPDDNVFLCTSKCIHCEAISNLPPEILKRMPMPMSCCEYGIKPQLKERFSGIYDCFLEESTPVDHCNDKH